MNDPFAHLNLKQVEEADRKARAANPGLFLLAEARAAARDPARWLKGLRERRAIGYDGMPRKP